MRREAGWGRLGRLWRFWRLPPPASTNLHNLQNLLLVLLLACQARGSARGVAREFDGGRAFSYVEQQMQFGPRIPNTPAHERTGDWILAQLRARADTVGVQAITHVTRRGDTLHLRNFLARFRPAAAERVLFLAHWDTRPHADQSANLGQQRMPVPGANDGASGVAVLLGVADALKAKPRPWESICCSSMGRTTAISATRPRRSSARAISPSTSHRDTRRCSRCCSIWS